MKQLIEIQAATSEVDSTGAPTPGTFATVDTVYAEKWGMSGTERQLAAQNQAMVTHRCRIRFWNGLTTGHRIKHGSATYNIRFVNDVESRGVEMLLDLEEIVGKEAQA